MKNFLVAVFAGVLACLLALAVFWRRDVHFLSKNPLHQTARILMPEITPLRGLIRNGSRAKPFIAFTFDADMTPKMQKELQEGRVRSWYDARIPAQLISTSVPATFFITGMWAEIYPNVVKTLAATPSFEIGNHTYDHKAFAEPCYRLTHARAKTDEITRTQEILKRLTGSPPHFFRFPGGCAAQDDIALVNSLGLEVVGWDVNSTDAFSKKEPHIVAHVLASATSGSIIVMHVDGGPNSPETASSLMPIIRGLRAKGLIFVTLSQLLGTDTH